MVYIPLGNVNCSGTMVANNLVLTAAHCFNDYSISGDIKTGSGHTSSVKSIYISEHYDDGSINDDWALLVLNDDIGSQSGFLGTSTSLITSFTHYVSGFPYYRPSGVKNNGDMYTASDSISIYTSKLVKHYIDTSSGQSGSSLYYYNGLYTVTGVHVAGTTDATVNYVRKIDTNIINKINELKS